MKIGLSGDTSVAAASVRNRSLQDLTRWERRKPEAYLGGQSVKLKIAPRKTITSPSAAGSSP